MTVLDRAGKVVHEVPGAKDAGLNRIVCDLRYGLPPATQQGQPGAAGGRGFGMRGPRVQPGEYTIKVSVAGKESSKTLRVEDDPRIQIGEGERAAWRDASIKVFELQRSGEAARRSMQNLKTQLTSLQEALKKAPNANESLASEARSLVERIDNIQRKLVPVQDLSGRAGPPLPGTPRPLLGRVNQLANQLDGYTAAPTEDQRERIDEFSKELKSIANEWNKVVDEAVPGFNKKIREGDIKPLNPGPRLAIPN